jgi:hypothetical protein
LWEASWEDGAVLRDKSNRISPIRPKSSGGGLSV